LYSAGASTLHHASFVFPRSFRVNMTMEISSLSVIFEGNPIQPGESFTYEFTASPSGTFMYHSHLNTDTQVSLGLYAPLIIDPIQPVDNPADVDVTLMLRTFALGTQISWNTWIT
jgi:FtsP/CotA-like multicopper oxidase with cupredoxin domain